MANNRNQDGSRDRRQTSSSRGGRGQRRSFTTESYNRLIEGARRGGQNSHQADAGSGSRSTSNRSTRGNTSSNRGSGGEQSNDRVLSILDTFAPEIQNEIRDHFRSELRSEIVEEVFDEIHGRLDEAENQFMNDDDFNDDDFRDEDDRGQENDQDRRNGGSRSGGNRG